MAARTLSRRGYSVSPLDLETRPDWVRRAFLMQDVEQAHLAKKQAQKQ